VHDMITQDESPDLNWFPRLQCLMLDSHGGQDDEQQSMQALHARLGATSHEVGRLATQLRELRDSLAARQHMADQLGIRGTSEANSVDGMGKETG